jgi:predicted TIM-barrel fold metal-dependent hydrolase
MDIVDAHHHLWDLGKLRYPWLLDPVAEQIFGGFDAIRRDYRLSDYRADVASQAVVKSVHVQANTDRADTLAETRWLQSLADDERNQGFPQAIVAYADLCAGDIEDVLASQCTYANVRGIRQILNYHPDPKLTYTEADLLREPRFERGFALLADFGLSFDLQCYYPQMTPAAELAARYPGIPIILNHAGMPAERDRAALDGWRDGLRELAACPNVAVKLSGLGMCDPTWTLESLRPFVLDTIEIFGPMRVLFGSNFPVDKLFSSFAVLIDALMDITTGLSDDERRAVFHDNAIHWYRLT